MQGLTENLWALTNDPKPLATLALGSTTLCILALWYRRRYSKKYSYPRGPPGSSFFMGSASDLGNNWSRLHMYLSENAEKYGDFFSLNIMGTKLLVVNSSETIHEVTVKSNAINNRPSYFRFDYILDFEEDITFGKCSPKWLNMRKTALTSMKTYSDGLKRVEALSHQNMTDLLDVFAAHDGQAFTCNTEVKHAITNFMSWLVYGEGMDKDEVKDFNHVSDLLSQVFSAKGFGVLIDEIPLLRFLPSQTMRNMNQCKLLASRILSSRLKRGKARYDPNDMKCSLDVMLNQQTQTQLSDISLDRITGDLVNGGTDTTTNSLLYFITVITNHPEAQMHAQKCIDETIGVRLPLISDKASLPYIEAMSLEVLRLLTPAAIVSRSTQSDTDVLGYHVPKGTTFFINIWNMHHNEKYWEAPYEFRPDRFIGDDGEVIPPDHLRRKNFMPFGAGRRVCVGEVLARNRLFLFFTAFLQRFTFKPESPEKPPPWDPRDLDFAFFLNVKDYKIRAIPRVA